MAVSQPASSEPVAELESFGHARTHRPVDDARAQRQTERVASRTFPFAPRSAARLSVGDLLAVPNEDGTWAVLQVSALRTGPGSRSAFGVGVLPWRGASPPTAAAIEGMEFLEHALTRIEIFSDGGVEVVGTAPLAAGVQSNLLEISVGTVHEVWGWATALERARSAGSVTP